MKKLLFLAVCGMLTGCATDPADSTAVAKAADKENMVCTYERASGSHMSQRVCRTRDQVAAEREQARRTIRDMEETESRLPGGSDG